MRSTGPAVVLFPMATLALLMLNGCSKGETDPAKGLPPDAKVEQAVDLTLFSVDHPEQYPLAAATEHPTTSELVVTGTVSPHLRTPTASRSQICPFFTTMTARAGRSCCLRMVSSD